ncbi:hypothetical protein FRB96_001832 [Tulasnella sp. 330]|nr:hypothetical protein FRB96_001832 [Tulasnella sp. 330]
MDRSHLLQGLRTGGPRSNSFATQPGQQPGGPNMNSRFQNNMYGDESDVYQQQINLAQGMAMGGGATLQQQQQQLAMMQAQAQMLAMMQAQGVAPTREAQALQMQMEVIRLQALQQQKNLQAQFILQSQLAANQNRRRSELHQLPSTPSTPVTPSGLDPMAAQTRMAAANQLRARAIGREASAMNNAAAAEEQQVSPPPTANINLSARVVSTPLNPNAAAFVGRFNPDLAVAIAAANKNTSSGEPGTPSTPTYGSTTVISGGTSLGSAGGATPTVTTAAVTSPSASYNGLSGYNSSPVATSTGPTKSDSAMSWRRGSSATPSTPTTPSSGSNKNRTPSPPLRQLSTSPPADAGLPSHLSRLSISSASSNASLEAPLSSAPSSAIRIRPSPLRFMKAGTEEEQQAPATARSGSPASLSTEGGKDENEVGSANGSPTNSTPPSSASSEDNSSQKKEREDASKRLYEGLGLGRPLPSPKSQSTFNVHAAPFTLPASPARAITMPAPAAAKQEPLPLPHRQPIGPPSSVDELGPRNFASRLRKKALGGLGVLMDARDRREGCPAIASSSTSGLKKRKGIPYVTDEEQDGWTGFGDGNNQADEGGIEMPSDDEDDANVEGMSKKVNGLVIGAAREDPDDDEVDEFPEINSQSDTDEEDSGSDEEEEDADEGRSESDETSPDEDSDGLKVVDHHDHEGRTVGIYPKATIITSGITGESKKTYPEIEPDYNSDSSTEDQPNRVGRIPMHWYDDLPHVGYDMEGRKVLRPAKGDELDKFLATHEDPKSWMSGFDHSSQKDTELSMEELDLIRRLQEAENPDASYNPYEPTVEWFTGKGKEEVMPLSGRPQPKSRWQPSKWEKQKVMKIVRLIRAGKIVPRKPKAMLPQWYNIWSKDTEAEFKYQPPIAAPKMALPKHAESYNPPEEYLPNAQERKAFDEMDDEDKLRAGAFLPQKYASLRLVPGYDKFIQERHSRLLDLYLAPRIQKVRLNINPDSLLPSLPSPQSLKPFPVFEALKMSGGGSSRARCLSISPDGVWTAVGGEDGVVRVWETFVGREAARWELGHRIGALEWCPRKDVSFFMVGIEDEVYAFMPPYIPPAIQATTLEMLNPKNLPQPVVAASDRSVKWTKESAMLKLSSASYSSPILVVGLPSGAGTPKQITFHRRGDYFATVSSGEGQNGVWIHQISKRHSQCPFKKIKGSIQKVLFHPIKPNFFVATQRYVRIYDLAAQKLIKTLLTGSRWISSMDVHPSGDHLIVGGYDKKLFWFDLDLADRPYKILRYHTRAVRSVAFSTAYPLFASSSDDGTIQIFHARVYYDLLTDPLIVPLKVLRGHDIKDGLGVLDIKWATGLAYDEILKHLRHSDEEAYGESGLNSPTGFDPKEGGFPLDDPQVKQNTRVTNVTQDTSRQYGRALLLSLEPFSRAVNTFLDRIHAFLPSIDLRDILPVSFEANTCAIAAGNDSTPSIFIVEVKKIVGTYRVTASRSRYDLYKDVYSLKLSNVKVITRTNPDYQISMVGRGEAIYTGLREATIPEVVDHAHYGFLRFSIFRRIARYHFDLIDRATRKAPPKWKGLARYMTDAQRRQAGELTHDVEYAKVNTILDTPRLDVTYYVDVPGLIPEEPRSIGGLGREVVDVGNGGLAPEWGVDLAVYGGSMAYGPWTDRQRDAVQKVFFPPTYVERFPTARLVPGTPRQHTSLAILVDVREGLTLRLPTRESSKDWQYDGVAPSADTRRKKDKRPFGWLDLDVGPTSSVRFTMLMVAGEAGYLNSLEIHLPNAAVTSSVNGTKFWTNESCRISCELPAPLKWDAHRQWDFDITLTAPVIYLLRDHVTLITDLIHDWASGPPSDFNTWVPTMYNLKFGLKDYTVKLYLNDHNVIDHPLVDENNSLFLCTGTSLDAQVKVPSDKFRPNHSAILFSFELPDAAIAMSLPDWNTHTIFAKSRPVPLGSIGSVRLDCSYTSCAEVRDDNVEKLSLDLKGRNLLFRAYGWSIRHFLRLKDNYFGRFTHFSTVQEYMEKQTQGSIGDPIIAKYRKGKSNVFEVTFSLDIVDPCLFIPQEIYDCKAAVLMRTTSFQVYLRLHDYFLELSANSAPSIMTATQDCTPFLERGLSSYKPRGGRILLDGLSVIAKRLFGPQPHTSTYLCIWDIQLGSLQGVLSPWLVTGLSRAGRAIATNYTDAVNAPDKGFELPEDPDITVLKVHLSTIDLTLRDLRTAIQLRLAEGLSFNFNNLAGKTYRKVTSVRIPRIHGKALLQSPFREDDWSEVATMNLDLFLDLYASPFEWRANVAEQMRFVLNQDADTRRLHFLYQLAEDDGHNAHLETFLPSFGSSPRRRWPRKHVQHYERPNSPEASQNTESENDSDGLTENERRAFVAASRPRGSGDLDLTDHSGSASSVDESDDAIQSTSSLSESESDFSAVNSKRSESFDWPRFEHYHHVLNRYRLARTPLLEDSTPFILTRDPVIVAIWPDDVTGGLHGRVADESSVPSESLVLAPSSEGVSVLRLRTRHAIEIFLTPLIVTVVRSAVASFDACPVTMESRLDSLLSEYIARIGACYGDDPSSSISLDISLPEIKATLLQRADVLQEPSPLHAGTPTQLLTASNVRVKEAKFVLANLLPNVSAVLPSQAPTKIFLEMDSLSFHAHTATSHPRSKAFLPTTLLRATVQTSNVILHQSSSILLTGTVGQISAEVSDDAHAKIANSVDSAVRVASKLGTTLSSISLKERDRKRRLVFHLLQQHQEKSLWTDPLSWTQASFIVKRGLPLELRAEISWRIFVHLRHLCRGLDGSDGQQMQWTVNNPPSNATTPSADEILSILGGSQWADWANTNDADEKPFRPILLDILYPPSTIPSTRAVGRRAVDLDIKLRGIRLAIADSESAHNCISPREIRLSIKLGKRSVEIVSEKQETTHAVIALSIADLQASISPSFIPFLSGVLQQQRSASNKRRRESQSFPATPILDPMVVEISVALQKASLQASALKAILDVRLHEAWCHGAITIALLPQGAVFTGGAAIGAQHFRAGVKATSTGSSNAADRDILAEIVLSQATVNIRSQELADIRTINLVIGLQRFRVNVPRSAIRLYHFIHEGRSEYTSKYDTMVRKLLAEIERVPSSPGNAPLDQPQTKYAVHGQLSVKLAEVMLQVMHGTWIAWRLYDSVIFLHDCNTSLATFNFGVDLKSQMIEITNSSHDAKDDVQHSAIRLPLPHFSLTGDYTPHNIQASAIVGFFAVTLKPQYMDDILAVQQKFGSDFVDLLQLFKENRVVAGPQAGKPRAVPPPWALKVKARLEGFTVALEGPSSTQYLNCAIVEGHVSKAVASDLLWDARCSSISLSLAHHSTLPASNFDRKFRSAYMDIEFEANNTRTSNPSSAEDQHFNLRIIRIHAVMQAAAIGELGDLIDYVQAEMLLRKDQRALELAEIRKKGKLLRTTLEREASAIQEASPSWLDRQVLTIIVQSIGVSFPLSTREDFIPASASPGSGAFSPSSVKAFLFSISSIQFATHRYERGALDIEDFSFQFIPDFDQSLPFHFEGRSHVTHNRLRFPRMKADLHSDLSGKTRSIEAGANVDGLELDLDTSITSYVFSLIDVYRQGKERIERLAPGQAQANLDAISARIASTQSVENHLATASSSNIKAKFSFQSGRVRLFPPKERYSHVQLPRLSSALSSEGVAGGIITNTIRLPELLLDGEFQAASASEKFTGGTDAALAKLKVDITVRASKNTIRPSVLPLVVEIMRDVDRRLGMQTRESGPHTPSKLTTPLAPPSESPPDNLSTVFPVAESVMGSHLHAQVTLRVETSHLELTCQPDVNVVAGLAWQSSQVILNIEPGVRRISVLGEIGGINVHIRHAYLNVIALTAEARNLIFNVVMDREDHRADSYAVASLSITTKTDVSAKFLVARLQDLLCFKAVWLDRIPIVEARPKTDGPSTPLPLSTKLVTPGVVERPPSTMVIVVTAIVQTLKLELDLGSAITKIALEFNPLEITRRREAVYSEFSVYVENIHLTASRLVSGHLTMPRLLFKTKRGEKHAIEGAHGHGNQLEVHISTGALDVVLNHDQMELFACRADPLESKVMDDWASVTDDTSGLRLDFSLDGGHILVMARMQAAPVLITTAGSVKTLLLEQKVAAAKESQAFRTTLHPKPANPLSEVAASMLMSAKSKFQEADEFEFAIVQRMHLNMAWIQLQLVDGAQTYHVQAETIAAGLECFLQTLDPAPRRDLHLSLGRFVVSSFASVHEFGTHKVQTDRTDVFVFPELIIRMKSTLQLESRQLDYEFDSSFPLQRSQDGHNSRSIDMLFDLAKWMYLLRKMVDLRGKVERSLEESGLTNTESDWWAQPLRSSSIGHSSSLGSVQESPQAAERHTPPQIITDVPITEVPKGMEQQESEPSKPSLTYHSLSTKIDQPRFRRFDITDANTEAVGKTFKSLTGVSMTRELPKWVHEYATVPIESVMKILLRIYAHRLRTGGLDPGAEETGIGERGVVPIHEESPSDYFGLDGVD